MKKYKISKGTLRSPMLEVDQAMVENARRAKRCVITMLTAEEKYDALIENYLEFEQTLLKSALEGMVTEGRSENWFNCSRNTIERRIFNFLSACRSYVEFASHCANSIASADALLKEEYRKLHAVSFAYRLMDKLRNHVTYGGHAAHIVTYSISREESPDDEFALKYSAPKLELSAARLAEANKFPQNLLKDIENMGGKISFVPLLREYLGHLSQTHDFLRTLCRPYIENSQSVIRKIFDLFDEAHPEMEYHGLLVREYEGDNMVEQFWIVHTPNNLDYFEKKNPRLSNLQRRFVTNDFPRA